MPLLHVAVLAALQGVTEGLPVSPSGHGIVARLWLDPGAARAEAFAAFGALGTALGLLTTARQRLGSALGEGVRAVARPALFGASLAAQDALTLLVGSAVSLLVSHAARPRVEMWASSPTAAGVGLCVSGLALASTALAARVASEGPASRREASLARTPGLAGAMLVGLAHGLAVFPGASQVGAALTVLLWIGVRPARAVDLALLMTAPALLAASLRGAQGGVASTTVALTMALAFLGVIASSQVLKSLAPRRRIATLALWTVPLGLAMLAYARALPHAE